MAKMVECAACGANVSNTAERCPECGHVTPNGLVQIIIKSATAFAAACAVVWFLFS